MEITKKEILENKQIIEENTIDTALMVAGFIPVIGEIADIILIIRYIMRKEYLYAGLMLIALIPTVGDFIAKPFIALLKGMGTAGKVALRSGDDMAKFLMENPKAKEQFLKMSKHFDNPNVSQTIANLSKVNKGWGSKLSEGINSLKSAALKLKPTQLAQRVGKEISTQGSPGVVKMLAGKGPVATGVKSFFREKRLADYIARTGKKPSTWLSNWYNVVRGGRKDRRNMVKQFIIANGVLNMFGLPSFESFEDKFMNDEEFREKLANDPAFSNVVNNSGVSSAELQSIEGGGAKDDGGGIGKTFMNLAMIKMLARLYA